LFIRSENRLLSLSRKTDVSSHLISYRGLPVRKNLDRPFKYIYIMTEYSVIIGVISGEGEIFDMVKSEDRHALRREQSIERLMRAALEVLKDKSYSAVRVEDITSRAGMAKGSLYMYFEGKEELYVKAIKELFLQTMSLFLEEVLKSKKSKQALRSMVELTFEEWMEQEELELLFRAVMEKSLMDAVRKDLKAFMDNYLGLAEKHFQALGRENPAQAAYLFFVGLDGLYTYRCLQLAGLEHWQSKAAVGRLKGELLRMFELE